MIAAPAAAQRAGDEIDALIVGESAPIAELRYLIRQVAPSDASVLITGPSGSGKEVVARATHAASRRAAQSCVAVNCGAIPRELLESELFGHEKGSFTGAHAQHRGRFEEADGGTLFLDEIGDMPADMQVKLLRVLEDRAVQRIGGRGQIAVDTRIVSATHRNIDQAIDDGRFREDLFYRLAVFPVEVPSLAERAADVPLLVRHFLKRMGRSEGEIGFTADAFDRLMTHNWPGNVRELRNLVDRAGILFAGRTVGAGEIDMLLLRRGRVSAVERTALWEATDPPAVPADRTAELICLDGRSQPAEPEMPRLMKGEPVQLREVLAGIEQRYIEEALSLSDGVIAEAARLLSLQRTTLIEKMRKYELKAA